jgi:hypothetical protein
VAQKLDPPPNFEAEQAYCSTLRPHYQALPKFSKHDKQINFTSYSHLSGQTCVTLLGGSQYDARDFDKDVTVPQSPDETSPVWCASFYPPVRQSKPVHATHFLGRCSALKSPRPPGGACVRRPPTCARDDRASSRQGHVWHLGTKRLGPGGCRYVGGGENLWKESRPAARIALTRRSPYDNSFGAAAGRWRPRPVIR